MMAAEGGNIVLFTYAGEDPINIPRNATHVIVAKSEKVIQQSAFEGHPNIIEVICHDDVERIEERAFYDCPSLRRVIMPGVKIFERLAFAHCDDLTDIECGKLEIIKEMAFCPCTSLVSINLPSVRIVENDALNECTALKDVKFGSKLERIEENVFRYCYDLERITIPLKDGMFTNDNIFQACVDFKHVDLLEGALHETIAALHFEEWRQNMRGEINSINRILPYADAGGEWDEFGELPAGEKAQAIRAWIRSVIRRIVHYQAEHQRLLDEAAAALDLNLPVEIVMNNVITFLELPRHTFGDNDG